MEVNEEKTVYQTFTLSHQPTKVDIKYHQTEVEESGRAKYLGVVFDKKLTWKSHIEMIINKAQKRLSILKRMAGVQWGCNRNTLNTTYNMFIKPLFLYCCEPLITSSSAILRKLDILQNQALRLITGAVKTTPIQAMQILTHNRPLEETFRERALCLYEKLIRLPDTPYWREYDVQTPRVLKTQVGFVQEVLKYREEFNIPDCAQMIIPPMNPVKNVSFDGRLELNTHIQKSTTSDEELKAIALETIHSRYPRPEWQHIYTDGSRLSIESNAGAGVHSDLFSFYATLGPNTTHFDGEIEAIRISLEYLVEICNQLQRVVILSDCASAIQAITRYGTPESMAIESCRYSLSLLRTRGVETVLQWIPSHCGIFGNEKADELAKKGTYILQSTQREIPLGSAVRLIKNMLKVRYEKQVTDSTSHKNWIQGIHDIPDNPRYKAVAAFRLLTGHDCLAKHLNRFGIFGSPNCVLCRETVDMDGDHLLKCAVLSGRDVYARYWNCRRLMMQMNF